MWPAFEKFPSFSTVKLTLGHCMFQLILRFKIGSAGLWLYFKRFPNSQKDLKLRFINVALFGIYHFFPIHERDGILGFLNVT